ncbi:tetraacyldisaccharide 4'-kinase [Motilimonas eburnea]|uniref:tetraacyldisaccharide 4'-kinase n=1 Tax=Motilimonas eburnea TaxID=1737488 RepID=UPI001E577EF9|nr:tetraacyldisaccharide 4'-kinase [Motilimonas eburnea]MCE2572506.1 tetraacyldisaccharide 4'-kinase [Motilimonas eburnea]
MAFWYSKNIWAYLLLPLTALFALITAFRRLAYRCHWLKSEHVGVPTIVVGNLSVGGNGKTPVVIWLCEQLTAAGFKPGVISRGYGGKAPHYPYLVEPNTTGAQAGDEPVLIYHRCQCPVAVSPNRIEAAKLLRKTHQVDVIIADDGLQHYALQRDIELVVVDGERRYGNAWLLPSGPLRESKARLAKVDVVINNGGQAEAGEVSMSLVAGSPLPVTASVAEFDKACHGNSINACAGIGHPPRFFRTLLGLGFEVEKQVPFADHHGFNEAEIQALEQARPLFMTEKDAVKCRDFALTQSWYLPVSASINESVANQIIAKIRETTC